jgi:hypothetical protein
LEQVTIERWFPNLRKEVTQSLRLEGTESKYLYSSWSLNPNFHRRGAGSHHDLMMTGLDQSLLVRASAIKLSEERLRQARNQNNRVQGNRYSTQSLFFFEENSWIECWEEALEGGPA